MHGKLSALIVAGAGLLAVQNALAADLPAKNVYKAPVAVVAQTWTGFYVGANAGWARSHNCWIFDPATTANDEGCHNADGAVAGGQIGYNWQTSSWVLGLEASGDWANLKGSNQSVSFPVDRNQTKVDTIGMFTGRLGVAGGPALLYLKGGAAVTHNKYLSFVIASPGTATTTSDTRWGWVIGAGAEYMFLPNWSIAAEYDYLDMGSKVDTFGNFTGGFACTVTCQERITQRIHMVTARLNYRFWTGP